MIHLSNHDDDTGVCAGCDRRLRRMYHGFFGGLAIADQGKLSLRVCTDARCTDSRNPVAKKSCVAKILKRAQAGALNTEGLKPESVEWALKVWTTRIEKVTP